MIMNMMKADGDDAINVRRRRRRQGKGTALNLRGLGREDVRRQGFGKRE